MPITKARFLAILFFAKRVEGGREAVRPQDRRAALPVTSLPSCPMRPQQRGWLDPEVSVEHGTGGRRGQTIYGPFSG